MSFLTFKTFISIEALIAFYYLGALGLPFALFWLTKRLIRKYAFLGESFDIGRQAIWDTLTGSQKGWIITAFMVSFLFMELFWRMLFEFLIAYMQIRDALLECVFI